jgi:hypothetical protein
VRWRRANVACRGTRSAAVSSGPDRPASRPGGPG